MTNALKRYLDAQGIKQGPFADQLELSRSYFSELVQGTKTPSMTVAAAIAAATGGAVPVDSWVKVPGHRRSHGNADSERKGAA